MSFSFVVHCSGRPDVCTCSRLQPLCKTTFFLVCCVVNLLLVIIVPSIFFAVINICPRFRVLKVTRSSVSEMVFILLCCPAATVLWIVRLVRAASYVCVQGYLFFLLLNVVVKCKYKPWHSVAHIRTRGRWCTTSELF